MFSQSFGIYYVSYIFFFFLYVQGKPIHARIKSKPVSRLGCLSVLASYGGKTGSESKDGISAPPSTPGSAGIPSGPGTPQQSGASFGAPAGQRFMYSPPTSVSASSYTPNYTMPANMPTAFVSILCRFFFPLCQ